MKRFRKICASGEEETKNSISPWHTQLAFASPGWTREETTTIFLLRWGVSGFVIVNTSDYVPPSSTQSGSRCIHRPFNGSFWISAMNVLNIE